MSRAMQPSQNHSVGVRARKPITSERILVGGAPRREGRAPDVRWSGASLRKEGRRLGVVCGARQAAVDDLVQ
jgi:hypothetical protein